jgi:eukaryotic-like serine/threonine-protein kinase
LPFGTNRVIGCRVVKPELEPGTLFAGDYRIVQPLSVGGMGTLYVVEQVSTHKLRALKLMHNRLLGDESSRRRFEQEASLTARIPSDHVVEVHGAGVDAQSGLLYLVMELLEGENLEALLGRRGPLPPADARVVMEQICHAVGAAHQAGIVHRDLKPTNVFLARSRRTDAAFTVKVLDFGIAKLLSQGKNQTAGIGSPLWIAPEQAGHGQVTPATDVWALGLLAFFLLTGASFWASDAASDATLGRVVRQVLFDPIPAASARALERGCTLPPGFDDWFAGCLNRDPAGRFPDAQAAFAALAPLLPPGGTLGTDRAAPPGMAAELRAAYESGGTGSAAWPTWGSPTGSAAWATWGTGSSSASAVVAPGTMSAYQAAPALAPATSSLASARTGMAVGCLVAAAVVLLLGLVVGSAAVAYSIARRSPSAPSGAVSPAASAATAEPSSPDIPAPSVATSAVSSTVRPVADASAPAPSTDKKNPAPVASAAPPPTATSPGQAPTRDLAFQIAHAVAAININPCLYSNITRPNNGQFAEHHVVTVRFDGTKLLGIGVQGNAMYPASDYVNGTTYKPATQAEVDAELSRVLGCIRGKVGGVRIPDNQARGSVAVKFSGSDMYDASVL